MNGLNLWPSFLEFIGKILDKYELMLSFVISIVLFFIYFDLFFNTANSLKEINYLIFYNCFAFIFF